MDATISKIVNRLNNYVDSLYCFLQPNPSTNTLTIKGDTIFENDAHFYQDVQILGNENISGNLNVDGDSTFQTVLIEQTLGVLGTADFEQDVSFQQDVTIEQDLYVNGNVHFANPPIYTDLHLSGNLEVDGNTVIHQDLTVDGNVYFANPPIYNDLHLSGNLEVDGYSILHSANITTTLIVSGNTLLTSANLSGNLQVSGNSFLTNANVSGNLQVSGNSFLTNANLSGNLQVSGNTLLASANVLGNVDVGGNVMIQKDLYVTGNIYGTLPSGFFVMFDPSSRQTISNQSNVSLSNGQKFVAVTSMNQNLQINLPTANYAYPQYFLVTDESGSASNYSITVKPGVVGETISGGSEMVIQVNYGTVWFYSVANSSTYFVMMTRP